MDKKQYGFRAHLASQFWPIHFGPILVVCGWWFGQFWPIHFCVVGCVVLCVVCCVSVVANSHEGVGYRPTRGLVHVVPGAHSDNHISENTRFRVVRRVSTRCPRGNDGSRVRENQVGIWTFIWAESFPQQHREEVQRQVHRPRNAGAPESSWSQLDEFDLAEVFATRVPTLQPSFAKEVASGFLNSLSH